MAGGTRVFRALPRRPLVARYGFALGMTVAALLAMYLLEDAVNVSVYSILVGAVALAVWYGGFGPGVTAAVVGWLSAIEVVIRERASLGMTPREAWLSWGIALAVATMIVWVSFVLRRARAQAVEAAGAAEESVAGLETLQALSSRLSAAASVSDVVTTLVESAPAVVGAPVSLGFVEEGEIVIAGPEGLTLAPWQVVKLTEGRMLHRTATQGRLLQAVGREEFEATFPDTAALAPQAEAAIAVPLRVEGRVIGSLGFVFDDADFAHEEAQALALVVAGLGGQALERARLFEREQESRHGLERILRVAPRFFTGSESMVTDAICREARTMFGADVTMLWRVEGDRLELVAFDPEIDPLQEGLEAPLADFPRLRNAVESLSVSFVPDVRDEARGDGFARVTALGLRSSLRVPIVIAAQAELVLVTSWRTIVSQPDPSTLVLVRRFADQAGLALEQVERRRAQAEATRRAVEASRFHEMTLALAHAATPADVGAVCLEHARLAVGATGGFVVRAPMEGVLLGLVATIGDVDRAELDELTVESDAPVARAVRTGEPEWAFGGPLDGVDARESESRHITVPLSVGSRVLGAVQLMLADDARGDDETKVRLESVVAQCALALERSFLLDSERRLRRLSERLQAITAELSNALTRSDVAGVLLEHVHEAVGTDGGAVALLGDDLQPTELLGWNGYEPEVAERWLSAAMDAESSQGQALRRLAPTLHHQGDHDSGAELDPADTGHASFLFAPLVLGRRPMALLVASAHERLDLGAEDLRFVGALAGQAAQALERARRFETEQNIAETLQRSVLPTSMPEVAGVQLAGTYLPGTAEIEVGGDWFDAIQLPNGRIGLVVGDVVGKGVRAAATMSQLRNAIRAFSLDRLKPATTLARLGRLADDVIETSFATVVYAELDPESGTCRYAAAGHPPPLLACLDGRVEYLNEGRGLPIGTGMPAAYRQGVITVPDGGVVLFYTDGLIERRGRSLDEGLERLHAAVASGPREPQQLVDHVVERLLGEDERRDDVVLLAARRLPIAPHPIDLRLDGGEAGLRHLREALRLWLSGAGVGDMDAHDIVLAAWEACANATEHGRSESGFRLRAELADSIVRIVVEDNGTWIPPRERSERGRGLRLMRSLMSSVEIEPASGSTRVTLEKKVVPVAEPTLTTAR